MDEFRARTACSATARALAGFSLAMTTRRKSGTVAPFRVRDPVDSGSGVVMGIKSPIPTATLREHALLAQGLWGCKRPLSLVAYDRKAMILGLDHRVGHFRPLRIMA